ncbi:MAG: hypothetical protein ACI9VR_001732 [Cognaticolwellia sp.]|jgi:hypothetical protein
MRTQTQTQTQIRTPVPTRMQMQTRSPLRRHVLETKDEGYRCHWAGEIHDSRADKMELTDRTASSASFATEVSTDCSGMDNPEWVSTQPGHRFESMNWG